LGAIRVFLLCAEELTKKLDELEERAEDLDKKRNIQQPSKFFVFYILSSLGKIS
jgi:hypothetical protein